MDPECSFWRRLCRSYWSRRPRGGATLAPHEWLPRFAKNASRTSGAGRAVLRASGAAGFNTPAYVISAGQGATQGIVVKVPPSRDAITHRASMSLVGRPNAKSTIPQHTGISLQAQLASRHPPSYPRDQVAAAPLNARALR